MFYLANPLLSSCFVPPTPRSVMLSPLIVILMTSGLLVLLPFGRSVSAVCTPFTYSRKTDALCVGGLAASVNPPCNSMDLNTNIGFCEVAVLDDLVTLETKMRVLGFNDVSLLNIITTNKQVWAFCDTTEHFVIDSNKNRFNTLRPRQNGRHFADDTFKHIFLNENVRISIKISLKFVPNGPINNIQALV